MLCVQKLCFNGFMETDADLVALPVGAHYKGRGEGTGPELIRGGTELIRKCRLCGRPTWHTGFLQHPSVVPWGLSKRQESAAEVWVVRDNSTSRAEHRRPGCGGNQAVREYSEARTSELSVATWERQNADLFYGWLWKHFLAHSIWGNFTKKSGTYPDGKENMWIPFFSKGAWQKKEDTSGNLCSECGIACLMGVSSKLFFLVCVVGSSERLANFRKNPREDQPL